MTAKIYRPEKNPMQSGKANTKQWFLEYIPEDSRTIDPIMGWTSNEDSDAQVRLKFENQGEAVAYAEKHGINYKIVIPAKPKLKLQTYSENFN
jgi:hypothetical protein